MCYIMAIIGYSYSVAIVPGNHVWLAIVAKLTIFNGSFSIRAQKRHTSQVSVIVYDGIV